MKYLAHISEDGKREQTVSEHNLGTAAFAETFAERFGCSRWGYCCGLIHDVGKYSLAFQERIWGNRKPVDHSTAALQLCLKKGGYYSLLAYCAGGHHTGLPDKGRGSDHSGLPTLLGRKQKKIEDYQAYEKELELPLLDSAPFQAEGKRDMTWEVSFFIRMLFSCLIDADRLDTERFMNPERFAHRGQKTSMKALLEKLEVQIAPWLENRDRNTINGRRTEILKNCLERGACEQGLFRLTVPTGGGKTIASLAFALRHAVRHHLDRVIYVIPYTSIIEQNAQVFSEILGSENVLEHHSNVDYPEQEEYTPLQLAVENWDMPVIVTTGVQFFESLFSNKASKCRKLHNIANSVIIFDEAQMLPNDYLKPCLAAIEELTARYKSTVVLCTATQPTLDSLFSKIKIKEELCPAVEEQFRFFKRTRFENLGRVTKEELVQRIQQETQVLCILNKKQLVRDIYQEVKGDGVYHLSTFLYPVHRKRILKEIRERLKNPEKKCVVIATSLVEAGVDLDFAGVYRQLAGLDSLIQAAGRCNRNGKRPIEESITRVFELEGEKPVQALSQQIGAAKQVLEDKKEVDGLESIEAYFRGLYHSKGESLDKKGILAQFQKNDYPFATVAREFKLIEQDTRTVFVGKEEEAKALQEEIERKGLTKSSMRKAGQYSVQIYEQIFEKLYGAGIVELLSEEKCGEFYVLKDLEHYSEETGLETGVEEGEAIFW